jgi:hypothetical protein
MDVTRFEWDPAKDFENFARHGVSFSEAQVAFADQRCVIVGVIRIIGAGFWRKGKALYERENSLYR